jgi:surface antigen Omp85-like protein/surface antigen-like variable number repeat protein
VSVSVGAVALSQDRIRAVVVLVVAGLAVCGSLQAQDAVPPTPTDSAAPEAAVPDDATLVANGAHVGEIIIHVGDIFDPEAQGENHAVNKLVNKVHRRTRESTIRHELLFRSGDLYDPERLAESERVLRQAGYLYDADIRPVRYADGMVDVEVKTRDVWTLQGGIGFGRGGGANSVHVGLEDKNFMGWGKDVEFKRTSNIDRVTSTFQYHDPHLVGSGVRLGLMYSDNSDGSASEVSVGRPFLSLDSHWGTQLRVGNDDRVDSLYDRGTIQEQFRHTAEFGEISGGWSRGLVGGRTHRLLAGFTVERDQFETTPDYTDAALLPGDRSLAYPWIGYETIQDKFVEGRDLDRIARTEDLQLGQSFHARLGYSSTAFGADRNQTIAALGAGWGLRPSQRSILFLSSDGEGRFASGNSENLLLGGTARYFLRDFGMHGLSLSLHGDIAHNLDAEDQLLLGGDNGLRGYPLRYQSGDRRVLFTAEQRFYTDWHPLKLFRVGAAVFFDAGRAWFRGESDKDPASGVLRDVGFGLRLGSSRSALGSMVHIDFAMPLDGDPSISRMQLVISTKGSF